MLECTCRWTHSSRATHSLPKPTPKYIHSTTYFVQTSYIGLVTTYATMHPGFGVHAKYDIARPGPCHNWFSGDLPCRALLRSPTLLASLADTCLRRLSEIGQLGRPPLRLHERRSGTLLFLFSLQGQRVLSHCDVVCYGHYPRAGSRTTAGNPV